MPWEGTTRTFLNRFKWLKRFKNDLMSPLKICLIQSITKMILKMNNDENAAVDKLLRKLSVIDDNIAKHQQWRNDRSEPRLNKTTDDTADQATTAALAAQQVAFQSIVDGQLKAFQTCMQACMEANNKHFDNFVRELKASLEFTQKELHKVKLRVKVNNDGNAAADKLLVKVSADIKRVSDTADYTENQSRRNKMHVSWVVHVKKRFEAINTCGGDFVLANFVDIIMN